MTLGKAIAIASDAHNGQYDNAGKDYILHPLAVMQDVMHKSDTYKIVAMLHDIIEDTKWFLEISDKNDFLIVNQNFGAFEISKEIYIALKLLTHVKGQYYADYILKISKNKIATRIKLADLKHNSNIMRLKGIDEKDIEHMKKYHTSFLFLTNTYKDLKDK